MIIVRPTVTVLVLSFNRPRQLRELLDSIRAQTFGDFECIVCDDASTNVATVELLARVASGEYDDRFRTLVGPWRAAHDKAAFCTPGALYNAGTAFARGEYISVIGVAGAYKPRRLERLVEHLRMNPEADVVWGHVEKIHLDDAGHELRRETPAESDVVEVHQGPTFAQRISRGNFVDGPSALERTATARRYPFSTAPEAWPDMDWRRWKEMAADGLRFDMIAKVGETKRVGRHNLGRMLAGGASIAEAIRLADQGEPR